MTLLKRLGLALCLALSFSNFSNAQVDQVTGNLLTGTWTGAPSSTTPAGGYSGGWQPTFNTDTNTIQFGYSQGTASQSIPVAAALANSGSGVQVTGYAYSWNYYNQDMNRGTLSGTIGLTSATGTAISSYSYTMGQTTNGWTHIGGTQNFASQYMPSALGNLTVSFTGKDDRWWAGYYGPLVKDIDVRLRYGVDPCATNPAYSTQCAGFSTVLESTNLVPNPTGYAVFGNSINQSYAINQALTSAGTGITVHGFKWGYVANANGPYCRSWDMGFLGCWDIAFPSVNTNVRITDNNGATIYSVDRHYENSYNTTNYSYLFNASRPLNTLGGFHMSATTNDQAYIGSMWSKALYSVDPCSINPLSSPTCAGYASALLASMQPTTPTTSDPSTSVVSSDPTVATNTVSPTTSAASTSAPTASLSSTESVSTTPVASTTPTATSSSTSAAVTSAAPTANNPQPKVGEVSVAGAQSKSSSGSGPSLSTIMNILSTESNRVGNVEKSVVQAAVSEAQAAAQQAQQAGEAVAATLTTNSIASSMTQASSTGGTSTRISQQSNTTGSAMNGATANNVANISAYKPYTPPVIDNGTSDSSNMGGLELTKVGPTPYTQVAMVQQQVQVYQAPQAPIQVSVNYSLTSSSSVSFSVAKRQAAPSSEIEIPKVESLKMGVKSALGDYLDNKPFMSLLGMEPTQDGMVKRNVQPNEAAGGVDIASIATQPKGFEAYATVSLQDAQFYRQESIYKNQTTVDNTRLLRGLTGGSDRRHQEMVDSQYKIGN